MSQIDARSQACSSAARPEQILRLRLLAQGQVQGVGFRPFIYRLAAELHLTGSVGNTSEGVLVEVQGRAGDVRRFPVLLREQLPPLARLTGLESEETAIVRGESEFRIVMSHGHHGHNVLISPDVGLCPDCAADMRDPENRRHGYAFTNCTNCGPRYTITRSIPYDRAVTSMACFPMCPECAKEYGDPLDRRFHAQPVACPACGPRLWFVSHEEALAGRSELTEQTMENALERACVCLLEGRILALRGLGGFQLACDARSAGTLGTLRQRKNRPHKSFALMVRDLETARTLCLIDEAEAELLASPARPAVILQAKERVLPPEVAPDIATLAVMLPTTPLHVVLFDHLAGECLRLGRPAPVLVMTSGNDSGDPICLGNREALARLRHIADDFLLHNRDILCRVDDSVVACSRNPISGEAEPFFFRRARGYVPSPTPLGREADACSFGAGADLKATCCLTRG
ncbi:MAG: Sua5/YciO/YrdC/YwlC family protein, partial [Desulfovibrionaceae bacterium]|nr:Sua5/YciO/YrdC/YwlC family protein [Desulfovibrionaceae bacterium]